MGILAAGSGICGFHRAESDRWLDAYSKPWATGIVLCSIGDYRAEVAVEKRRKNAERKAEIIREHIEAIRIDCLKRCAGCFLRRGPK
jgi:hypothetical protein